MTKDAVQFKINSPDIVSETIDGEAVIVSLSRGVYYSLDQVGVDVWDLISKGYSSAKIVRTMQQKFDGEPQLIERSVLDLFAQLQAEQLVTAIAPSTEEDATPITESPVKEKFVPPVLQKYSDMVDLLMLDPIHDVDETEGWPTKREDAAA